MSSFQLLTSDELKELGFPMGPRKLLIKFIESRRLEISPQHQPITNASNDSVLSDACSPAQPNTSHTPRELPSSNAALVNIFCLSCILRISDI
jgi:hypothetical protein